MLFKVGKHITVWLLLLLAVGCAQEKPTNWNEMYFSESKDPYGFYLFTKSLSALFPNATVKELPQSISIGELNKKMNEDGNHLFICVAESISFTDDELVLMANWIASGNDVLLIADRINKNILEALSLELDRDETFRESGQIISDQVYKIQYHRQFNFLNSYLKTADSTKKVPKVISRIKNNHATTMAFTNGRGRLLLSSTPFAFSNYFLLEKNNRQYLEDVFAYTIKAPANVYYSVGQVRTTAHSDWSILWKNRATRMAIIIALISMAIFILFQAKRRQRMIPVIEPLRNDAATFVETIGKLYYNKKDNQNLAQKIVQHFFEFVRNSYQLNTMHLDEDFEIKLSGRSGKSRSEVNYLLTQIKMVQNNTVQINDAFLFSLYRNVHSYNIKK